MRFPRLEKISVACTPIGNASIAVFNQRPCLRTLNLSNTPINFNGIRSLNLERFDELSIYGLGVTSQEFAEFRQRYPKLRITCDVEQAVDVSISQIDTDGHAQFARWLKEGLNFSGFAMLRVNVGRFGQTGLRAGVEWNLLGAGREAIVLEL